MTDNNNQSFFRELCEVVDRHSEDVEEAVDLIDSMETFREDWLNTYGATTLLWQNFGETHLESQRRVTNPDRAIIDVPHDTSAEAELLQETRERLAMLETHVVLPEQVGALKEVNDDLEAIISTLNAHDTVHYSCTHEL